MRVELYGKKDCKICEAAKEKLSRLGVVYEVYDLEEYISPHDSSNPLAGGRVSGWSPMCHFPNTAVVYPRFFRTSPIVAYFGSSPFAPGPCAPKTFVLHG